MHSDPRSDLPRGNEQRRAARRSGPHARRDPREQLGLTWEDAHLGDDPKLTIDDQVYRRVRKRLQSGSAYRAIPLSPGMAMALTDWRARAPYPDSAAPIFPSKVGTTLDYSTLLQARVGSGSHRGEHPRR